MVDYRYKNEGLMVLRIVLGLFFLITGLLKLFNPQSITGLLTQLGFSTAVFWGWIVILTEIIFGVLVLIGWKPEISVWPLVVILIIAIFKVYVPQLGTNPMAVINILFHIAVVAAFITLAMAGPGRFAVTGWPQKK